MNVIHQYYACLYQSSWEEWDQGVQLERFDLKRASATFVASEGGERLDEDTKEF